MQTTLASSARKLILPKRHRGFLDAATVIDVTVPSGATLRVHLNLQPEPRPLVAIVPGWLGNHASSYVISSATSLWRAGFSTARVNLRDHGGTEHLNEGLFHSGLIEEAVELMQHLDTHYAPVSMGVLGYSLGGNFALRIAAATHLPTFAVCPALDPASTMAQLDRGVPIYRHYFIKKWLASLAAKEQAFPQRFDFTAAMPLTTVGSLTDYFVRYHSSFDDAADYFSTYDLTTGALAGVQATVVASTDDPIIPISQFSNLSDSVELLVTKRGGHGAYIKDLRLNTWIDAVMVRHFATVLSTSPTSH